LDVDPPDADGQTGGNFKKSQSDLADGGRFQFGTLQNFGLAVWALDFLIEWTNRRSRDFGAPNTSE
jgi:hypothetical protein